MSIPVLSISVSQSVSPSSGQAGGSGIRLSRWEEVTDAPFKTSVETENNKLAGNL